jgi:hypothetical protein
MTQTIVGVQCPNFMKDFDTEYLPHQEWLLTAAYSYATSTDNPATAIDLAPFNKKERETIKDLVVAIGFYNNRPDHYLIWDYEISGDQAGNAHLRIMTIYQNMVSYYSDLLIRIEQFYDGGFFDDFEFIVPDASKEFADLVWQDHSVKNIEFASHAIVDFFKKYNYLAPKWKKIIPENPLHKDEARAIVIGDLLKFHHKTKHALWANAATDPRGKDSGLVLPCSHKDFIMSSYGVPMCQICDGDLLWGGYGI